MDLKYERAEPSQACKQVIQDHLSWIREHPNYEKPMRNSDPTYYDLMKFHWSNQDWSQFDERFVNRWFEADVKKFHRIGCTYERIKAFEKKIIDKYTVIDDADNWAFITVGWNEQTITPEIMKSKSKEILEMKYFKEGSMCVLEKHRANGLHHHTHFLVRFTEKVFKTKIIQYIFQKIKRHCLEKHFIDVLGPLNKKKFHASYSTYEEYVRGIKQDNKLKFIEMDRKWRDENKISHIYIK